MIIRGVWLTNVASSVLDSRQSITDAISFLADTGFNTVFPVVWNKGFTLYPSQVIESYFGADFKIDPKYRGRDPLLEIINAASQVGIKVIPWFEYGFAASHISVDKGKHIFRQQPNWIAINKDNKPLIKEGFEWMNALNPEVQDFMLNLMLEVARYYDVDGIQGDDRIPSFPSEGGYDRQTKDRFFQQCGYQPPTNTKDKNWLQFRANILTSFLETLYKEIKSIAREKNKEILVSIAPHPLNFGFREYLQDWETWLKRGLVDIIHPQLYRRDIKAYKLLLREITDKFTSEELRKFFPGILIKSGNFRIDSNELWNIVAHNRQCNIAGEVFFFYEGLREQSNSIADVLRDRKYSEFV